MAWTMMKRIKLSRISIIILVVVVASVLTRHSASALEIVWTGSKHTSYNDAVKHVSDMGKSGYFAGHGLYIDNFNYSANGNQITVRYTTKIIYQRFRNMGDNRLVYAILGKNGLCPVAGWYNSNPDSKGNHPAYDCIKYQDENFHAYNNFCSRSPRPYLNNCNYDYERGIEGQYNNEPWNTVRRLGTVPTTRTEVSYNFTRTFSVNIANRAGRINVATDGNQVCSYYQFNGKDFGPRPWQSNPSGDPTGRLWCQDIELWVEWSAVKHPTIHLTGADSYAKEDFIGSKASADSNILGADKRGSYSQYGLLTGNNGKVGIKDFGSAGYTTASSNYSSLACKLSYANTAGVNNNCDLHWLRKSDLIKQLSMPTTPTNTMSLISNPGGISLSKLKKSGSYHAGGNLTINSSQLQPGRHIMIFVDGDVTISDNINTDWGYSYSSLTEIPNLVIVANGDIKVAQSVRLITGTYVAKGRFISCDGAPDKGFALGMVGSCRHKLKVNGAIISANSPAFRRTFGAGDEADDDQWNPAKISSAAEWINYTPNLWLVPAASQVDNRLDGLSTTQVTSLPVRY